MPIPVILMIALILPTFFFVLMVGPVYIGLCASLYFFYKMDDFATYIYDPNYVLGVHEGLYDFGMEKGFFYDIEGFTIPVYGPVFAGIIVGLILSYIFISYIRNIFRINSSL